MEGLFQWTSKQDITFQAIKKAIESNAIAPTDRGQQYHLAVDASKKGIGGVLFQLNGIKAHTEANNSQAHRDAARIIMSISFRL